MTDYIETAKTNDEYTYYHASVNVAKEVFPEAAAGHVILLKDYDEGKATYTEDLKGEKFGEFLQTHAMPTLNEEITQKVIEQVFRASGKSGVFLFRSATDPNAKDIEAEFKKVAAALKAKDLIFVVTDIKEGWGQRVGEFFGMDEKSLPVVEVVSTQEDVLRYRFDGKMTEAELKDFMTNWRAGKVSRFLKSEPMPEQNPGPVKKVVGKSFKQEVMDNDDDVILKFYAPWCGHCKKLEPVYKALAEAMADNKKLRFYEVDATKNDIEGHPIHGFPVIKFFPGKDKSNPQTYEGDRSESDIAKFIKEKSSNPVNIPELKPKDEADKGKDDL